MTTAWATQATRTRTPVGRRQRHPYDSGRELEMTSDPTGAARFRLTRLEVATRLGISASSVRRLEGVHLHPVQDDRGVWRFDPAELDRVPQRSTPRRTARLRKRAPTAGEVAARIFRMLESGRELTEIVIATRQS